MIGIYSFLSLFQHKVANKPPQEYLNKIKEMGGLQGLHSAESKTTNDQEANNSETCSEELTIESINTENETISNLNKHIEGFSKTLEFTFLKDKDHELLKEALLNLKSSIEQITKKEKHNDIDLRKSESKLESAKQSLQNYLDSLSDEGFKEYIKLKSDHLFKLRQRIIDSEINIEQTKPIATVEEEDEDDGFKILWGQADHSGIEDHNEITGFDSISDSEPEKQDSELKQILSHFFRTDKSRYVQNFPRDDKSLFKKMLNPKVLQAVIQVDIAIQKIRRNPKTSKEMKILENFINKFDINKEIIPHFFRTDGSGLFIQTFPKDNIELYKKILTPETNIAIQEIDSLIQEDSKIKSNIEKIQKALVENTQFVQ